VEDRKARRENILLVGQLNLLVIKSAQEEKRVKKEFLGKRRAIDNDVAATILLSDMTKDKYFFKTIYWSAEPGKFVKKFTGEATSTSPRTPNLISGTTREWFETLVNTIIDASNISQEANGVKPIIFNAYNRTTKETSFSESLPFVSEIRVGERVWTMLQTSDRCRNFTDYTAKLFSMDIKFDPMLDSNCAIVGEYGKNPVLITVLDAV
jgi:hypothetical protein